MTSQRVQVDRLDGASVVTPMGLQNLHTAEALGTEIDDLIENGETNIVVDLSEVSAVDSTIVGFLFSRARRLRKLGGAAALFLVFALLDALGFVEGREVQTETARQAVRAVSSLGPIVPLALGAWLALRFPLCRADHARIRAELDARAAV